MSEITLPLNSIELSSLDELSMFLHGYEQEERFVRLCSQRDFSSGRLIDLSQLFSVLISIVTRQTHLLKIEELRSLPFFKAQITGVWRRVPFIDMPEVMSFFERHGIPLIQEDECFAPPGTEPDTCLELREWDDVDPAAAPYANASVILAVVAQALWRPLPGVRLRQEYWSRTSGAANRIGVACSIRYASAPTSARGPLA